MLLEDQTASFIVRVWRERGDGDGDYGEWRGSIEHVQSKQKTFFRELPAMERFMKPYLEAIGIDTPQRFWEHMSHVMATPADDDTTSTAKTDEPSSPRRKSKRLPRKG